MNIALVGTEYEENLALRHIHAALEGRGHSVSQITFNAEADTEAAAECLARSGAGLAAFSMVFTYRAAEFAALARSSRELVFRGHLVAEGHFAAFDAEALLRDVPAFDSFARWRRPNPGSPKPPKATPRLSSGYLVANR